MLPETLGVVGLGAVGGSVAWGAILSGVKRVIGYSFSPRDGVAAVKVGAVSELSTDIKRLAMRSEMVVLATSPGRTLDVLDRIAKFKIQGAYLTDVSPVKAPVVDRAEKLGLAERFAGSHPITGVPAEGFEAARADGLVGRVVYVTPIPGGDAAARETADFWDRAIGAHPVMMGAQPHDAMLARTSHLPRTVASALANALRKGPKGATFGRGALTVTQPAAGEIEVWADVLTLNRGNLLKALSDLEEEIDSLREVLRMGDKALVLRWLDEARSWRDGVEP